MQRQVEPDRAEPAIEALGSWLGGARLGAGRAQGGLALVPVYVDTPAPKLAYRTLADAIAAGAATVTETPRASVPTLRVDNRGALAVLILDGDEIQGGNQNRVVNTSLLIPPRTIFDLPVTCVEHGRWRETKHTFETGEAAYPSLREQKMQQVAASLRDRGQAAADQGAVWDEVASRHRRDGAASPTGAMKDAYDRREVDLHAALEALPAPADGATGVLALIGGRARCLDLFDRAETLRAFWPRLVRSYALEAGPAAPRRRSPTLTSAERLLSRARQARRTAYRSPGLGLDLRLSGNGVVGAALLEAGVVVHTAIFRHRRDQSAPISPIRRPS